MELPSGGGSAAPSSAPASQPSTGGQNIPSSGNQGSQTSQAPESRANGASGSGADSETQRAQGESANDPLSKAEAAAERKKWQIKASGKDWDLEESDLVSYAQKGIDSDSKWQEAARIREQNNEFLRMLRENPREVLQHPHLKLDLKKLAHDILYESIEQEMMSPEERAAADRDKRLKAFEERDLQTQQQQAEARQQAEDTRYQKDVDTGIRSSLGSAQLPVTEFTYDSTIKYMQRAMRAGYKDVTPESVLPYVKRDYQRSQEQLFAMEPDKMLDFIGEKGLEKIQQAYIARVRGKKPGQQQVQSPYQSGEKPQERNLTLEEWREDARRRMANDL